MLTVGSRRFKLTLGLVCCGWLATAVAWGQPEATLDELKKLHDRLADPQRVLTSEDVAEARHVLELMAETEGVPEPEDLSPEDRGQLWRVKLYVALAHDDARTALAQAQALLDEFPDEPATLAAAYLAACAAGDAQLGSAALAKLAKGATRDQRRVLSQRRRWIRAVGKKAPDVSIKNTDGAKFSTTRRRGKVLLVDFWNLLTPPEEAAVKALRKLYEQYRDSRHVEFVGVNADTEGRVADAREFAKTHGYVWPQHYEGAGRQSPITHAAFRAGKPPWQVLIDSFGYIRAIGSASEPGFQYALRAAVAEARGIREVVLPRTRDGRQPTRPSAGADVQAKPKEAVELEEEPPSNPEALRKLRLARTYLKTGKRTDAKRLFEEIVRDYAGTREAQQAQEYLDSIWNP